MSRCLSFFSLARARAIRRNSVTTSGQFPFWLRISSYHSPSGHVFVVVGSGGSVVVGGVVTVDTVFAFVFIFVIALVLTKRKK